MAGGTLKTLAEQLQVTDRTISNWRALPDYHHYADCVVNEMVRAGIRKARAIAANVLPDIASNAAALALGKGRNGKPKHPYQDKFSKLIMEAAGLHAQSTELAAEIPTDSGPVRLIFRSKAGWSDVQVQTDS